MVSVTKFKWQFYIGPLTSEPCCQLLLKESPWFLPAFSFFSGPFFSVIVFNSYVGKAWQTIYDSF